MSFCCDTKCLSWMYTHVPSWECPGGSVSNESACSAGDLGLIPELGRSPGEGNGNPLQCSCLENPMDGGAWLATVHQIARVEHDLATFCTGGVYTSKLLSQFVPSSPSPSSPHVHSLHMYFYSCPANKFICTTFLDSIDALINDTCFSLSGLTSLSMIISRSIHGAANGISFTLLCNRN